MFLLRDIDIIYQYVCVCVCMFYYYFIIISSYLLLLSWTSNSSTQCGVWGSSRCFLYAATLALTKYINHFTLLYYPTNMLYYYYCYSHYIYLLIILHSHHNHTPSLDLHFRQLTVAQYIII